MWRRYFGNAESRSLHLTLLSNVALFAVSALLITGYGESLLMSATPIITQQEAVEAARQPLQQHSGMQ